MEQNHASVTVDSNLLQLLRSHLRSDKKCFSGAEFVRAVMMIGQEALSEMLDDLDEEGQQRSSRLTTVDENGKIINFNEEYAHTVACYLLDEGILIPVSRIPNIFHSSTSLVTPSCITDEELAIDTSRRQTTGRGDSQYHHPQHSKPKPDRSCSQFSHGGGFSATHDAYYKFAASEDGEYASFMQSQILTASSISFGVSHQAPCHTSTPQPSKEEIPAENKDFLAAKKGTLYLVLDLLTQRAKKERVAKQFLASPRTKAVKEMRRLEDSINCDLIFKMS